MVFSATAKSDLNPCIHLSSMAEVSKELLDEVRAISDRRVNSVEEVWRRMVAGKKRWDAEIAAMIQKLQDDGWGEKPGQVKPRPGALCGPDGRVNTRLSNPSGLRNTRKRRSRYCSSQQAAADRANWSRTNPMRHPRHLGRVQ